ncbi:MAG TPA: ABC transporter substrate-binding protein [Ktedonobacteraceae bacterium]|nr:ABC transporter substrate-binding protein [Ktedonobacteraceae bacterium]
MEPGKNLKSRHPIKVILICTALFSLLLTACSSGGTTTSSASNSTTTPKRGGTIKYATVGDPPSLDMMETTADLTQSITTNIYEGLFTIDSKYAPQLELAQSYQVQNNGLTWTIHLRQGVLFQNGQEMTSADVLASLDRWGKLSDYGQRLFADMKGNILAPDKYTIVLQLKSPMPIIPVLLAVPQQQAAIYPKSVIDAAGNGPIKQYIGTGPYKFVSWKAGQAITLARFDQYKARSEPADGMAGKRTAYADQVQFIPVPEEQQRVQGVETGLYNFADDLSPDLYSTVKAAPNSDPVVVKPWEYPVVVFNKKEGLFSSLKMRQAVQAVANYQPMLESAAGNSAFYRLDPSLYFKETKWWSDAGQALYNQNNPTKAKQLLQEAGYHGQTVRILATQQYSWSYNVLVVLKSQLQAIGMKVSIDVMDWATLTQVRQQPGAWDIFATAETVEPDPAILADWSANWPGWWVNAQKESLLNQMASESDYTKRMALETQFQQLWYNDVPMLKVGDIFLLAMKSKNLQGPGLTSTWPYMFNNWVSS